MEIVLIVAVAENGVIGAGGAIPWRLKIRSAAPQGDDDGQAGRDGPQDLRLAAPAACPDAPISSSPAMRIFAPPGAVVTTSFADARAVATGDALRRFATEIAVIGGAEIYAQWMACADRLEITEVHARPEGDTHFAAIDAAVWEEVARVRNPAGPDDSADFSYVTYRRRKSH